MGNGDRVTGEDVNQEDFLSDYGEIRGCLSVNGDL